MIPFNTYLIRLKIACLIHAIFFLCLGYSYAQDGIIELLPGTQKLVYDEVSGAQKLIGGGVNLNYEGNKIYADSVFHYEKQNVLKAYGRVHIIKEDSLNLHCDSLTYGTKTHLAKLYGNVRVIEDDYVLKTQLLDYNSESGLANYNNGGRIENTVENETLTSTRGYLYPKNKNLHFSGNVKYVSDSLEFTSDTLQYRYVKKIATFFGPTYIQTKKTETFCNEGWFNTDIREGVLKNEAFILYDSKQLCGDSLYLNDSLKIFEGQKNIHFIDTVQKISFESQKAYFSKNEQFGYLTDSLQIIYTMKDDTLYMHCDSVLIFTDTSDKLIRSELFWDVQIYGNKLQASCDSMSFDRTIERATLFRKPILWSENAELKSDTMYVFANDSVINKVELIEKPTIIMEVDSGNYYNQIGGKLIEAFFKDNKLTLAEVNRNAQTNYFPQDTIRSKNQVEIKRQGMARLYASRIKIYLDSGEVTGITYFDSPDGAFYPIPKIPMDEKFINNFSYFPEYKPINRFDIFRQKRYFTPPVEGK